MVREADRSHGLINDNDQAGCAKVGCWLDACVARLSCRACEFEKRENRPGSKKGPGSTGNRAGGSSGGQHVAGQQTDERNREKGSFFI